MHHITPTEQILPQACFQTQDVQFHTCVSHVTCMSESSHTYELSRTTGLRAKAGGAAFCVATYHMPCVFWDQRVMVIHSALVSQKVCV